MTGTIKIGAVEVEMLANAASPIFYKRLFREDFLLKLQELQGSIIQDGDQTKISGDVDIFSQMGFIMHSQVTMTDAQLLNLRYEDFVKWLAQFSPLDVINASGEIANLYMSQDKTVVEAKKKGE